jgi:hypothetical protein
MQVIEVVILLSVPLMFDNAQSNSKLVVADFDG